MAIPPSYPHFRHRDSRKSINFRPSPVGRGLTRQISPRLIAVSLFVVIAGRRMDSQVEGQP